jgi:hypothetical protein
MDVFLRHGDRTYHEACVDSGSPTMTAPARCGPYLCLLWDHDGRLPAASRDEIARVLLESGCRYAVCAGANASEWEATVDLAFVRAISGSDGSEEDAVVMTTSHAAEGVDDVAFFFVSCTNFGEHHLREFVVLHIGGTPKQRGAVVCAVRAAARGSAGRE